MTDQAEQDLRAGVIRIIKAATSKDAREPLAYVPEFMQLIAEAHKGYEPQAHVIPSEADVIDQVFIDFLDEHSKAFYNPRSTPKTAVAIRQRAKDKILAWHQANVDRAVEEAERVGFNRGVYAFSNYFMDASNKAQRQPIMPHIAKELVDSYDPMAYKSNPLITPPHNPTQETK